MLIYSQLLKQVFQVFVNDNARVSARNQYRP